MSWLSSAWQRLRDRWRDRSLAPPALRDDVPRRLGPYLVLGKLGSGGAGTVFRCHDPHRDRTVAVKRLHPELARRPGARRRFLHEGRVSRSIRDDNVVATYAVLAKYDPPLLVMEYLAGGSVADLIAERGALSIPEVVHIGIDVARGLRAVHARRLVHTDLKPANVLVDDTQGRFKIGDFGLARVLEVRGRETFALPPIGTPSFLSPEQAQAFPLDPRSDLYSLGALLYATCAGHPPFPGDSTVAVLRDLLGRSPQSLREIRPDVPGWLARLIHELLAKTPAFRPSSAVEVLARLERGAAESEPPAGARKTQRDVSRRIKKNET